MSRTASQSDAEDQLDLVLRALADRTRRAVLKRLLVGPASVTELAEPFPMSLPAVSKHLKVLERAGLVSRDIDGRVHRCSIDTAPLATVDGWLSFYRQFWAGNLDSLADYLESEAS